MNALIDSQSGVALGLRANWRQFSLLVLVNAFVGGMVGLERTVVPLIGAEEFHLASTTLVVSFIVSFGVVKAFANLVSGQLADLLGRKRVLVLGWAFGLPVPFMIMWGPSWEWIVAANALLGINQGFAWSMTVIMKIDLVGPKSRGLAVGLNEFAGYLAVGVTAYLTGLIASGYPSLIAAVSDASHPTWRVRSLSVYRFWRDLGYAIGALSAGLIADAFGLAWAIASIATLTFVSGAVVAVVMREPKASSTVANAVTRDRAGRSPRS